MTVNFCPNCRHPLLTGAETYGCKCPCHLSTPVNLVEKLPREGAEREHKALDDVYLGSAHSEDWGKEFQDVLKNRMRMNNDALLRGEIPWIMDFIRSALTSAKASEREEIIVKLHSAFITLPVERIKNPDGSVGPALIVKHEVLAELTRLTENKV